MYLATLFQTLIPLCKPYLPKYTTPTIPLFVQRAVRDHGRKREGGPERSLLSSLSIMGTLELPSLTTQITPVASCAGAKVISPLMCTLTLASQRPGKARPSFLGVRSIPICIQFAKSFCSFGILISPLAEPTPQMGQSASEGHSQGYVVCTIILLQRTWVHQHECVTQCVDTVTGFPRRIGSNRFLFFCFALQVQQYTPHSPLNPPRCMGRE